MGIDWLCTRGIGLQAPVRSRLCLIGIWLTAVWTVTADTSLQVQPRLRRRVHTGHGVDHLPVERQWRKCLRETEGTYV